MEPKVKQNYYFCSTMSKKDRIISFLWQHVLLLVSLYIMTFGVAVCVRSMLGSSVISTLPYVFETAGKQGLGVPQLTIGQYTYIMNALLVVGQICVLRRRFEADMLAYRPGFRRYVYGLARYTRYICKNQEIASRRAAQMEGKVKIH